MNQKNKSDWRINLFLVVFIIGIFLWIVPSTISFVNLDNENRAGELPQWIKNSSPLNRAIIVIIFVQLPYLLIALGLFGVLLKKDVAWKYNKDKFLTFIGVILSVVGVFTLFWNWILIENRGPLYDTIIYGIGFGILFLLSFVNYSGWLKLLLWTRLIEIWGPFVGYVTIPAAMGRYTGGAFGHFGYGMQGMITSPYFWTDFLVQIFSVVGVMYLLKKSGTKWFWILSFSIGAVIVGYILSIILPRFF